tara:strand:- start:29 stop:271 length:243 start_codon:yes stop_codon:yes gene_type:complete
MILNYVFIIFITIFFNDESYGKKRINVDGVFYECKSPKNSFERTRGVRNRICVFSSEDKIEINKRNKNKNLNLRRKFKKR